MPPFWNLSKNKAGESNASPAPKSSAPYSSSLRTQFPTPASSATKIRLAMMSTAMVDALGAPPEFHKRFEFDFVSSMGPNHNFKIQGKSIPAGAWTDDTSMTLCLAQSISTFEETTDSPQFDGFDEVDQLRLYTRWYQSGYLSSVNKCFDIGLGIRSAVRIFEDHEDQPEEALLRIRNDLANEATNSGNGSLMRIIPIGLAYWRDETQAKVFARRSSQTTHPSAMCLEVCEMWTGAVTLIMQHATQPDVDQDDRFSKLSLLEYISNYPYNNNSLRESLALPFGVSPGSQVKAEREAWYFEKHPLMRLIARTQSPGAVAARKEAKFAYNIPTAAELPSTGFVLHSAVAALYCFFSTKTFEEGALMAVNLGYDADTVGAIYAGLAGCWYAAEEGKAEGIYWTKKVREWQSGLVKRNVVEEVTERLVALERKLAEANM